MQFNAPFLKIWSYSLLSNHSHHIVKVSAKKGVIDYLHSQKNVQYTLAMETFLKDNENESSFNEMLERQMNSFLVSYANYYNNRYERKGGLFQKPFRRIEIADDAYLQQAIIYANANAQKHKIIDDFTKYPHNSYQDVMQGQDKWIALTEILDFFGNKQKFEEIHKAQADYYYQKGWPSSKME
jgi:REP element-mobilizing transposase RayT